MRPAEVTDEQIIEAGRRIQAEGKAVNGWSLRAFLGNKGKPQRNMAIWEKCLAEGADAPSTVRVEPPPIALPPGVAEMADDARGNLIANFNGILLRLAQFTDESLKLKYKSDFDRLATERAGMAEQLALAEASVTETEQTMTDAHVETETLRGKLTDANQEVAVLAERLRFAETKAREYATEAEGRISGLEEQVRAVGAAAQRSREDVVAAEATAAAAAREAERLRQEIEAARMQLSNVEKRLATAETGAHVAEQEAGRLRKQVQTLNSGLEATRAEIGQVRTEIAVVKERADNAEAHLARTRSALATADAAARDAAERAGAADARAAQAGARADAAEEALRLATQAPRLPAFRCGT